MAMSSAHVDASCATSLLFLSICHTGIDRRSQCMTSTCWPVAQSCPRAWQPAPRHLFHLPSSLTEGRLRGPCTPASLLVGWCVRDAFGALRPGPSGAPRALWSHRARDRGRHAGCDASQQRARVGPLRNERDHGEEAPPQPRIWRLWRPGPADVRPRNRLAHDARPQAVPVRGE